ncbi:hypothetical protein SAPIO_CDS3983 [Scedosporium apiospermum]|uniref:DUF7730 domain-containing protein n=1 Tax=Pseudallescheria apiosperma TaxID=563466 RepID=A0A084G914_PSEDA|nr:uncharacterized protein SAPIO_CDS3983 [Scedosporium apiospermum]KEZ43826.1 hypothetical protein SAPIO_CDS3983 [Scedosporium apiospermum]
MSKFKKWVRRVLPFPSHNSQSSSSHPSELSKSDDWPVDQCPVLPEERPRPLTASSSNESLVHSAAGSTASSLFFRLPYEVRRKILIEAFGERILHINLTFGHPKVVMDKEDIEETYRGESAYLFREVPHCGHKIARPDSPRRVNGYTEAVEVLYGTNTFHISNNPTLLRLLPELLLPQRREAIRSVELKYDFFRIYSPIDPPMTAAAQEACDARLKAFCSMIDAVPKAFPCLRQLHVSPRFEWFHYRMDREDCVARWKADVFPHLAAIVSQLDALEECVVTVGYLVAEALVSEALIEGRPWCHKQYRGVGRLETDDGDGQWEYRAWMPVSKCVEGVEGQAAAEEEGTGKGFWTVMGELELDTNAPVCFAF